MRAHISFIVLLLAGQELKNRDSIYAVAELNELFYKINIMIL
jgi:hypothetical protein